LASMEYLSRNDTKMYYLVLRITFYGGDTITVWSMGLSNIALSDDRVRFPGTSFRYKK